MRKLIVAFLALALCVCAWAHDPHLSGIGISLKGGRAVIGVQVHLNPGQTADIKALVADRLALDLNGTPFVATKSDVVVDKEQGVAYWTATYEGQITTFSVKHRLFTEDPESRTIVSVTKDGESLAETIIDARHPSMNFGEIKKQSTWNVVSQFLTLGITHIFTGPDHILFIFGLILLGGGLKPLLKTVTAFTVAHSITLTVAATGLWTPASKYVEPLIALSIVAVAIENLRPRKEGRDWRPWIAFGFGLIHGFGFAGGLTEVGLPQGALGWALASFNIGVECAQALIVLTMVPILGLLAKNKPKASRWVVVGGSCAIALAGAFWFVDRIRAPQPQGTGAQTNIETTAHVHPELDRINLRFSRSAPRNV